MAALQTTSSSRAQSARRKGLTAPQKSSLLIAAIQSLAIGMASISFMLFADQSISLMPPICAAGVLVLLAGTGRFRTRMIPDFVGQIQTVAGAVILGVAVPTLTIGLLGLDNLDLQSMASLAAALFTTSMFSDWISVALVNRLRVGGHLRSRAVMIGSGRLAKELEIELALRPEYGVDVVAVLHDHDTTNLEARMKQAISAFRADRVVIAPVGENRGDTSDLVSAVRAAVHMRIPVFVVPRLYELGIGLDSMSPDRARGYPMMRLQRSAHPFVAMRIKRFIDVVASMLALALAFPLMLVTAAAVKVTSPGPVLFRQERVGQNGQVFEILKFRTMSIAGNEHSERHSDYRITSVGRFLRKTSVDELPQFWNVLRGDMTIIGPRPERTAFVEEGLRLYDSYADRHRMPMGLTGLAQVAGLRGEDTSISERIKFDNLYVDQWSLALDFQILLKTFFAIVLQTQYRRQHRELQAAMRVLDGPSTDVIDLVNSSRPESEVYERAR